MKKTLLIFLLLLTSCSKAAPYVEHLPVSTKEDLSLMFATDLHYLDPSLHVTGPLFDEVIQNGDGKVVHYADQMLDAFILEVLEVHPDFLFLTGDLSFNGEKASHEVLAEKLSLLEDDGIIVYVIPGNHDIGNPRSRGYGETKTYQTAAIDTQQFAKIYRDYGYLPGESIREPDTLSYLVKLNENTWMFMLDSNNNTKPSGKNTQISGAIDERTMAWMGSLMDENTNPNLNVLVSMHHNLYRHSDMINDGFTLDNPKVFGEFLKAYNIKAVFSGHIHIQSIVSRELFGVSEFVTNALSVSPNQYGMVSLTPTNLNYQSHQLNFTMNDGADFQTVSSQYFLDVAYHKVVSGMSESNLTETEILNLATVFSELNAFYFAGLVVPNSAAYRNHEGYRVILDKGVYRDYLEAILENQSDSNQLLIDLR